MLSFEGTRSPLSMDLWRGPQEVSVLHGVEAASEAFVDEKRHVLRANRKLSKGLCR